VAKLRLLEVGRDPQTLKRNQHQQVLPRGDVLVDLDALAGDDARLRSHDFRVAQVSLPDRAGPGLLDLGLSLLGAGTLRGHLLRAVSAYFNPAWAWVSRSRATFTASTAACSLARGRHAAWSSRLRPRRRQLLLADDVLFDQRLVALQIGLRLRKVGLGLGHARRALNPVAFPPAQRPA